MNRGFNNTFQGKGPPLGQVPVCGLLIEEPDSAVAHLGFLRERGDPLRPQFTKLQMLVQVSIKTGLKLL